MIIDYGCECEIPLKKIKFDHYFYEAIKREIKTCTTRTSHKNLKESDIVLLEFTGTNKTYKAKIEHIEAHKFKYLDSFTAAKEGYGTVGLFKQALKSFYPDLNDDSVLYTFYFRILWKKPKMVYTVWDSNEWDVIMGFEKYFKKYDGDLEESIKEYNNNARHTGWEIVLDDFDDLYVPYPALKLSSKQQARRSMVRNEF